MNNKKDIQDIVVSCNNKVEHMITTKPSRLTYERAAFLVVQAELKLKNLKLSAEDRQHFSMLREAMQELRKALQAGAKGDRKKYDVHMQKSQDLANEYARRVDS
ncbi:hypothetical protein [Virgibacillus dokdonensis]|uniref:Uncharacterized protein n=1 Tax=Virgibacillus dokdonensis TaxID=302167 RepID=A0A2K9J1L1_9BACI|nr:hypothetical protein [Virgibacillus dokdonensis]AUJ25842.1 hypothetical protein A21D_02796 [Virgibacillus dokdonensis]